MTVIAPLNQIEPGVFDMGDEKLVAHQGYLFKLTIEHKNCDDEVVIDVYKRDPVTQQLQKYNITPGKEPIF